MGRDRPVDDLRWLRAQESGPVRLLEVDPDLAERLDPGVADAARRRVVVRSVSVPAGHWQPSRELAAEDVHLGTLVLGGLVVRRVAVGERRSAELLGAGDLLRPHQPDADEWSVVGQQATWRVLSPLRLALLGQEDFGTLAKVPGLVAELLGRAVERSRTLGVRLALAQVPRLDDRLRMVLWHLADRWGRRERDAVVVPLRLSQELLAELACAQRTSVGAALKDLAERGLVERRADGTFALYGAPTLTPEPRETSGNLLSRTA